LETNKIISGIKEGAYDKLLLDIYVDDNKIEYQKQRYISAIESYIDEFGEDDVEIYSAPGRSEVGGNHTDHQHGEILAASINLDAIGIVKKTDDMKISILSKGYTLITISLENLEKQEEEKETTIALIKGVVAGFVNKGYKIGGFKAYITSDVLIGAGLSSSAAYETLIGNILSGLYNNMSVTAEEIAIIGQFAENVYFGKPCGLMDQMACSVGNLVHVDFANTDSPIVEKVEFDLNKHGYSLCITDTKGSHADLTSDYAAVPEEMKKVASYFGKDVLLGITMDDIIANIREIRTQVGDRGVLRAVHFIRENERVQKEVAALKSENIKDGYQFKIVKKGCLKTADTGIGLFYKDNDVVGTLEITKTGEEVSEATIIDHGFYDRINLEDEIVLVYVPEDNANKESVIDNVPNSDEKGNAVVDNKVKLIEEIKNSVDKPAILEILRNIN